MNDSPFVKLTGFLRQLDEGHIHYSLASHRDDALMVLITVPGERWEVEFFSDGLVEVERFVSDGQICGEEVLKDLLARYADRAPAAVG